MDPINQFVTSLQAAVNTSLQNNLVVLINLIPNMIAAFVLIIIGWLVGVAISKILEKIFHAMNLESILANYHVSDALGKIRISKVIVKLTEYYIILVFLQAAISLVGLGTITDFLSSLLGYAPILVGATILFVFAAVIGELVKEKIVALEPKSRLAKYVGVGAKLAIVFMGMMVGLSTLGFDVSIVTLTFVTLLQGIIYGIALAVGIAFGLGGQEAAKDFIRKAREKTKI